MFNVRTRLSKAGWGGKEGGGEGFDGIQKGCCVSSVQVERFIGPFSISQRIRSDSSAEMDGIEAAVSGVLWPFFDDDDGAFDELELGIVLTGE
jgi:hypothetical protein